MTEVLKQFVGEILRDISGRKRKVLGPKDLAYEKEAYNRPVTTYMSQVFLQLPFYPVADGMISSR